MKLLLRKELESLMMGLGESEMVFAMRLEETPSNIIQVLPLLLGNSFSEINAERRTKCYPLEEFSVQ